jgi:hypothetical protein
LLLPITLQLLRCLPMEPACVCSKPSSSLLQTKTPMLLTTSARQTAKPVRLVSLT